MGSGQWVATERTGRRPRKRPDSIGLAEFASIGSEQWLAADSAPVRAFVRLFGPLGMHARIRCGHVIRTLRRLALPPDARVLDAGCGHAYTLFWLARHFPGYRLTGIDLDPTVIRADQRIAAAMANGGTEDARPAFRLCSVEELDDEKEFDLIISIDVLEHVADDTGTLRRLRRALKPGGALILHLPLRHQQQRRIFPAFRRHVIEDHLRDEYTPEEIEDRLSQAGFSLRRQAWGFGPAGELAFELNYCGWRHRRLRALLALVTFPAAWPLAYMDVRFPPRTGNSMVLVAVPAEGGPVASDLSETAGAAARRGGNGG